MEIVNAYVIKRSDGAFVNLKFEPVKSVRAAGRFSTVEDYEQFMNGYYKPTNPADYRPQPITITYEEDEVNERIDESVSKN